MEKNYDFRKRLLQVHKPDRRMSWVKAKEGQVEIDSSWCIVLPEDCSALIYGAARDLEDYFLVSMGVSVHLLPHSQVPERKLIQYRVDPSLPEREYFLTVEPDRILLSGRDERLCARAGYYLEDVMNLNEGPVAEMGQHRRLVRFSPRLVHSGYGLEMFPDTHLRAIAHSGMDTILLYVDGINKNKFGRCEFNEIIYRASRMGLDTIAFVTMRSLEYPEGEKGRRFYDSTYGELFRQCPGFKGVQLAGENVEFPSRDPNTSGRLRLDNMGPDGHRIIKKPNPGWWPCNDYDLWINMVMDVIRPYRPDCKYIVETYNWGYVDHALRRAFLEKLPKNVTVLGTFEMFDKVERDGACFTTSDYTVSYPGPGVYFTTEAKDCKEIGLEMMVTCNSAGITWDVGVAPYIPAPYQWIARHKALLEAYDKWGVNGTMDSHHYGWTPSYISEHAKWMMETPDGDPEEYLRRIAIRDFSIETADEVLKAWKLFSQGVEYITPTFQDQYGPCRVGPAYPLTLTDNQFVFKSRDCAFHGKNVICLPDYSFPMDTPENQKLFYASANWYSKAESFFRQGIEIMRPLVDKIHPSKQEEARRQLGVCEFIANTLLTTVHVKLWYRDKCILRDNNATALEKKHAAWRMQELCKREILNAQNTVALVEGDSRLGYECSMDYMCDRSHLMDKIHQVQQVLTEELPKYL